MLHGLRYSHLLMRTHCQPNLTLPLHARTLLHMASLTGHLACGWEDAGALTVGARADLVTVRLDSARTAGVPPVGVFFAAGAADVEQVVVDGRVVVAEGRHLTVDVPTELSAAIEAVTPA